MYSIKYTGRLAAVLFCFSLITLSALAVPPTPEALEKWEAEGVLEEKLADWRAFKEAVGDGPDEFADSRREAFRANIAASEEAVDTIRVIVILMDFPDFHYDDTLYISPSEDTIRSSVAATHDQFDSLLFSVRGQDSVFNPTGSMTDYYLENSYGKLHIEGDIFGWYTASNPYEYYVGGSNGLGGLGGELVVEAVDYAHDHGADFSLYTVDGVIGCNGVIVVHAGPGAEGGWYGIWSHRSPGLPEAREYNGTLITGYTLNPEERFDYSTFDLGMTSMGVFGHEYGHVMGCPDVYDTEYNEGSSGLGVWSMMAGGSHNGGGRLPAHFDAYNKIRNLGFVDGIILDSNLNNAPIPQVESEPVIYILRDELSPSTMEYWLVENRQRVGFDQSLPAGGLCIYHIDYNMIDSGNTVPGHYQVGLEQADGMDQLGGFGVYNSGDAGDVWPGTTNNREFHDYSVPSAFTYTGYPSECGVWNITDSDSLMYADLEVTYSHPWVQLYNDSIRFADDEYGDADGIFEAGDTIAMRMEVKNYMAMSFNATWSAVADNADIAFVQNDVDFATALNPAADLKSKYPLLFYIPEDFRSSNVHFTIYLVSDAEYASPPTEDSAYIFTFEVDVQIGETQILLVDDDGGADDEAGYQEVFGRMKMPYDVWDKSASGSPETSDLTPYETVFWMTGKNATKGGTITAADINALEGFLNSVGNRNLVLSSLSAAEQIDDLDSNFLHNYLHANLLGSQSSPYFKGLAASPVGEGVRYMLNPASGVTGAEFMISPVNGGVEAFVMTDASGETEYGGCGVTYAGAYNTVLLTFPLEFIDNEASADGFTRVDDLIHRTLTFFGRGQTTDVEDDESNDQLPRDFVLEQNYPNPFNPTTTITYRIGPGAPEMTSLAVFNLLGQKVTTLVNEIQGPGVYRVTWDGRAGAEEVASGVYFYRLTRGEVDRSKKMIFIK